MRRVKRSGWLVVAVVASVVVGLMGVAQAEEGTMKSRAAWEG